MPLSQPSQFLHRSTLTPDRTLMLVMYNLRVFFCHKQQRLNLVNSPTGTSPKLRCMKIPGWDDWGVHDQAILSKLVSFSTVREDQSLTGSI